MSTTTDRVEGEPIRCPNDKCRDRKWIARVVIREGVRHLEVRGGRTAHVRSIRAKFEHERDRTLTGRDATKPALAALASIDASGIVPEVPAISWPLDLLADTGEDLREPLGIGPDDPPPGIDAVCPRCRALFTVAVTRDGDGRPAVRLLDTP